MYIFGTFYTDYYRGKLKVRIVETKLIKEKFLIFIYINSGVCYEKEEYQG